MHSHLFTSVSLSFPVPLPSLPPYSLSLFYSAVCSEIITHSRVPIPIKPHFSSTRSVHCKEGKGKVLGQGQELPGNKTSKSTGCECKRSSRRRNSLCTTTCCCSWQHRGLMERKMRLCSGCCLCHRRGKLPGVVAAALPRVQHVSFWPSV